MQGWFGLRLNSKSQTAHKQETEKPDEDIADRFGDRGYKGTEKKDSLGGLRRGECGNGLQRKDGQGNGKKSETRPYRLLYGNR